MRHQTSTDGAWQRLLHVARGMAGRRLTVVAEGTSAVRTFLRNVRRLRCGSVLTRLRLDAC